MIFYYIKQFFGVEQNQKSFFFHFSLNKINLFILKNHIYIKILKYKNFQIIKYLIKSLLKKIISKQFFNVISHK